MAKARQHQADHALAQMHYSLMNATLFGGGGGNILLPAGGGVGADRPPWVNTAANTVTTSNTKRRRWREVNSIMMSRFLDVHCCTIAAILRGKPPSRQ